MPAVAGFAPARVLLWAKAGELPRIKHGHECESQITLSSENPPAGRWARPDFRRIGTHKGGPQETSPQVRLFMTSCPVQVVVLRALKTRIPR